MVFEFASTSKITFPGAGISVMACSEANQAYMQKLMGIQMISYDKVNELRHVLYLKDKQTTLALMKKHAAVLAPKFHCVLEMLDREIAPAGHRNLAAAEGRLLCLGQHRARSCEADACSLQGSGRCDDRCGRNVPLRRRPAGLQHPYRPEPAACCGASKGDGGLLRELEACGAGKAACII